ncbi:acyltransferase family protein [Paraburkholderia sp. RL17-347-BIC-D]|uniref:acyltransferase family protein n=1 Tax=Paraburkholderia sp. RL17-347-BIC-D TaxID=3031632 RepID=UPI0038BCDC9E
MRSRTRYRNSFDLLRILAAIGVLYSHSFVLSGNQAMEPIARYTRYGSIGQVAVDVFFALSGYLMATSYRNSDGPAHFLAKRALRIFPALLVTVCVTVFVLGPILSPLPVTTYFHHPQVLEYLKNAYLDVRYSLPLIFVNNPFPNAVNGSLWSLPLEAFMYLVVASLGMLRMLDARGALGMALLFAALHFFVPSPLFSASGTVLWVMPYDHLTRLGAIFFFSTFLGCLNGQPLNSSRWGMPLAVLFLAIFANSALSGVAIIFALPYVVLVLASYETRASNAISRIGDLSYGTYLFAFPIQQTVAMMLGNRVSTYPMFAIALPVTLILAYISWRKVESPALELKRIISIRRIDSPTTDHTVSPDHADVGDGRNAAENCGSEAK